MNCPRCGAVCGREEADVEVGTIYGPWSCTMCPWNQQAEIDAELIEPCELREDDL